MVKITQVITKTLRPLKFTSGALARSADGSCRVSLGESSVLVTAVSKQPPKPASLDFVPLTVNYREEAAAAGRIPTTHLRRDIGTTEKDILTSRMIDRSVRSCFQRGFYYDTQIACNLLAIDGINNPDVLAINGASASLAISDIPWNGPVGAVRMGLIGEDMVPFPTRKELLDSRLNLVIATNYSGNIVMMDGSCTEPVVFNDIAKTIKKGLKECQLVIDSIYKLQMVLGKPKRQLDLSYMPTKEMKDFGVSISKDKLLDILSDYSLNKFDRDEALSEVKQEVFSQVKNKFPETEDATLNELFVSLVKTFYSQSVFKTKRRCDGRKLSQLRHIDCAINLHEPLHGSALFQRGQTQVFCSCTLDSLDAAFPTDNVTLLTTGLKEKNFMLHYEFPPFATNDIGKGTFMPGRREVGHGALAEKAIRPVVPEDSEYTTRLNCKVLDSNGSSSMASVCAGSMALMDAGVKLKEPVAGIAMGLITEHDETKPSKSLLLTDILGFEDYFGDMDFKIAGTNKAFTALQLDVKLQNGLPASTAYSALNLSQFSKAEILDIMASSINEPRAVKKDSHPVTKTFHVPSHKISKFIGFGGYNLKKILRQLGVKVSEYSDDSEESQMSVERDNFMMFAPNNDAMQEAEDYINKLLASEQAEPKLEFGGIYTATITEIREDGLMIKLYPTMRPTLLPLREVDSRAVHNISILNFEVGQRIQIKYFGTDPASGYMRISRRAIQMTSAPRAHDLSEQVF